MTNEREEIESSLDKSSSTPLYLQLAARIREFIARGELEPGDRIPSEVALARQFGLSPMTARHALQELVDEGVGYRRQSKGTYVAGLLRSRRLSIDDWFEPMVRAHGWTLMRIVVHSGRCPAPKWATQALGLADGSRAVCICRLIQMNGQPLIVATSWLPASYDAVIDGAVGNRDMNEVVREVVRIPLVDSEEHLWGSEIPAEEAALLGMRAGEPAFVMRGQIRGEGGVTVRAFEAWYKRDYFRLSLTPSVGIEMRAPGSSADEASAEWVPFWTGWSRAAEGTGAQGC